MNEVSPQATNSYEQGGVKFCMMRIDTVYKTSVKLKRFFKKDLGFRISGFISTFHSPPFFPFHSQHDHVHGF